MYQFSVEPKSKILDVVCSLSKENTWPASIVSFFSEVDLSKVEELRSAHIESFLKPTYTAFVIKAAALAAKDCHYVNKRLFRRWFKYRVQTFHSVNVAVICEMNISEAPMLAFADVIHNADQLALETITQQLQYLSGSTTANNKQLRTFMNLITRLPSWISTRIISLPLRFPSLWEKYRGGAIVVSSPGKYGIDSVGAVWSWPIGITFGVVKPRPLVKNNQIEICSTFILTINYDRRIMAGAQGAYFFKRVCDYIESGCATLPQSEGV